MNLDLEGRNCIVLGGSRGIGRAIALGLASEGANVAICARNEETLREAEAEIRDRGVRALAHACDVADAAALASFLDGARRSLGGVDVLVHNASALAVGPELADWEASLQVDLMAAVLACEQVIPWMAEAGGGSILFVSSISGLEADPAPDFGYTAAKAALIAHAKKLAIMHAPRRIRVNAIAPGSTDFPGGIWSDVAVFLVSPRASWVAGECVAVDGGQHRGMR
jgi:3-oxoacyl-[acyl-carrier protein] reductase